MKSLLALTATALLGLGTTACSGTDNGMHPAPQAPSIAPKSSTPQPKDSNDLDEDANSEDDVAIVSYGHAASPSEKKAITEVVKRYFAAAARENGEKACSLLSPRIAEEVPEEYGQPQGPPGLRLKACAVVMSKLFKHRHRQLAAEDATLAVTAIRTEGMNGLALLRFATTPEPHKITVRRHGGEWKVKDLLDSGMP